jgi:agmatine/peptidylarginine deiminase
MAHHLRRAAPSPVPLVASRYPPKHLHLEPDWPIGDTPIVETYINSYFANGALIVPTGGTADDEAALERLQEIVAGREVVGVPCPDIGYGGGGIHCITQQVPRV